ncbi:MAG: hypothetical protein ABSE91_01040 [Patescibacteria group bacterium]|jgi:hypothetical protein
MTETIQDINQEIDNSETPEQIQAEFDPETGKLTEFHRDTIEKTA